MCFCSLSIVTSADDDIEGWLERGTSNEETINIFLSNEFSGICISDRSTIKNSYGFGCIGTYISSKPLSDLSMGLLSNIWSSSLTSSNSPDWLICDDNLGPVVALLADSIELSSIDIFGFSGLSLLEELTDACKDCQSSITSKFCL